MKKLLILIIITLMCLASTGCVGTVKNLTRLIREVQTEERKTEAKQEEEHQAAENKKEENHAAQEEEKSNLQVEDHYVLVSKVETNVSENEAREQTDYFYDEYGNLIREEYTDLTDPKYYGNIVYTYDSSHRLINWTSEGNWHEYNNSCDYIYDANGNLIEWKSSRNSITETYTYDANGNLIRTDVDRAGSSERSWIVYTYNANGQLELEEHDANTTYGVYDYVYEYDQKGRLIKLTDQLGSQINAIIEYAYDENDLLLQKVKYVPEFSGEGYKYILTTTYTYDANGNMIEEFRDCSNYYLSDMKYEYAYMLLSEHVSE